MNTCKRCGSYAVNPGRSGRDEFSDLDLCDVCYWRKRADADRATTSAARDVLAERADFHSASLKLALDAECLLIDCTDHAVQSKWMDPLAEAITRVKECAERLDRAAEKGDER